MKVNIKHQPAMDLAAGCECYTLTTSLGYSLSVQSQATPEMGTRARVRAFFYALGLKPQEVIDE